MRNPVPPGWGDDELSQFFDIARYNSFATFHLLKPFYNHLLNIDRVFLAFLENWKDPSDIAAAPFAYRAHSAFRAAALLAVNGQVPETYMVLRGCLENALYSHYINHQPSAFEVWRRRGDSDHDRKACVREFSGRNLFDALRTREQHSGDVAGKLYERTIDLGAHPNEQGLFATMSTDESEHEHGFSFAYLTGDGVPLQLTLRSCAQVGVVVLDILALIFPDRVRELGLEQRLAFLRVGL